VRKRGDEEKGSGSKGKDPKPALPDVAAAVVTANVGGQQAHHVVAQFAVEILSIVVDEDFVRRRPLSSLHR
jgi:hypothetical protein